MACDVTDEGHGSRGRKNFIPWQTNESRLARARQLRRAGRPAGGTA